jgi:uncharacterized protein (DUF1778 family)
MIMEMDRKLAWKVMAAIVISFTAGLLTGVGGMMLVNRLRDYQQGDLQGNALMLNLAYQEKIKVNEMDLVRQAAYVVCALEAKDAAGASLNASETVTAGLVRLSQLAGDADVRRFMKELEAPAQKSPALRRCLDEAKRLQAEAQKTKH